jgi:A/G-specific adenine glycosylase
MLEVPSTPWQDLLPPAKNALRSAPLKADWWQVPGTVVHTFTHFKLELVVYRALVAADATLTFWAEPDRCRWVARRNLPTAALPSVMRKVIAHGLREQ